jgi:hypothetical protein
MNNWIPRNLRWNDTERAARRIASKNAREYAQMLWNEKENFRQSIEKEIEQKKLALVQASA